MDVLGGLSRPLLESFGWAVWWGMLGALATGWGLTHIHWFRRASLRSEPGRSKLQPRFFRMGGAVVLAGAALAFIMDDRLAWDRPLVGLCLGAWLALLLGLMDDMRPLRWWQQLLGQLVLGGILIESGMLIQAIHLGDGVVLDFLTVPIPGLAVMITLVWVVLIMNAVNWVDGVDGLMGSMVAVALGTLALLSLKPEVNQPAMSLLFLILLGALLGFLSYNWYPARLIAGTSGVAVIGFLLAGLAMYSGTKVATALLVLAIPILDMSSVLMARVWGRQSIFLPDQNHLHHLLLRVGWSERSIVGGYSIATLFLAWMALTTRLWEKVLVFGIFSIIFFCVVAWTQWILLKHHHSPKE